MSKEQSPEEMEKGRRLVNKTIKAYGILFTVAGAFLLLKDQFVNFELLGTPTDFYLGAGLFLVGIVDYIIADKILPVKREI